MNKTVDVLVVGGGPTGLLTAYNLLKLGVSVHLVERYEKSTQAIYGRACILWPRTLELLDQLGVYEDLSDIGFVLRGADTYRDGKRLEGRGWSFVGNASRGKTFFTHHIGVRQKYSEDVFRRFIRGIDPTALSAPDVFVDYVQDETNAEYPITANIQKNGTAYSVKCKYLIGADGARSAVRQQAQIDFPGSISPQRWIRLDAVVKTDMPNPRSRGVAIESPTHGNILWTLVDHGRTRLGYALPPKLSEEYDNGTLEITAEVAMEEARKAVAPFTLEFEELDWYTVYSISQRVADVYIKGNVVLTGDACHTHSSGTAQGMNTGVHDAINLSWKLGGYLLGIYTKEVFLSYESERRSSAQHLIQTDKETASLMSGVMPAHLKDQYPEDVDIREVLEDSFARNAAFTVGLAISYSSNVLNWPIDPSLITKTLSGHRLQDIMLEPPGARAPRRLYDLMPNTGRFYLIVCAGSRDSIPRESLRKLDEYLSSSQSFTHRLNSKAFAFLTIISGHANQAWELMGVEPFGHVYYDPKGVGYDTWGIDPTEGAVLAVRPDGILGLATPLDDAERLGDYFEGIVLPSAAVSGAKLNDNVGIIQDRQTNAGKGEISLENEAERIV
ncbi:FAD/NAD(P)-binding domain-containing protein [Sistotremastrum niveocremeum HHB9708]|uniref:FAD/NAD(P)-binding domain-containing protein n=1 Tax=Sistotremastrum niveocremeum HHB9708 TaxID=1314777 RepID=A0A164WKN3_9AGAM|nr:FAD/NAD(P)-binding domain-containing protein [Sistotremastrum niveocremeum HHB9708]